LALKTVVAAGSSSRVIDRLQAAREFGGAHWLRSGQPRQASLGARYTWVRIPCPRFRTARGRSVCPAGQV